MIKTRKKRGSETKRGMTEAQGNSRSTARLLITGLITSRCLVPSKGRERKKEKERNGKRDINACGVRKKKEESDTKRARERQREGGRGGFGTPRNKLTPVDVAGVPLISS